MNPMQTFQAALSMLLYANGNKPAYGVPTRGMHLPSTTRRGQSGVLRAQREARKRRNRLRNRRACR